MTNRESGETTPTPESNGALKLRAITFSDPSFRKLKNQRIVFSDRLTVIAGHNGVGKSSILAFGSNGSGLTGSKHKSYFDRTFQTYFHDIVYLDYEVEVNVPVSSRAVVSLEYVSAEGSFRRRASLSKRPYKGEDLARVVNRSVSGEPDPVIGGNVLGKSAKVPLPTIFLGMTRMLPIGETDHERLQSRRKRMTEDDAEAHIAFINAIIPGSAHPGKFTNESIALTRKKSLHPTYGHPTRAVSLGQDSISAIATAVASFCRLKREMGDTYPGGLLVIDEVDAGLHPNAQERLIKQLRSAARRLELQVIATSHALPTIRAVHPDSDPQSQNSADSVVYMMNTTAPTPVENISLERIEADMALSGTLGGSTVDVFVEDDQAEEFLQALVASEEVTVALSEMDVTLDIESLCLGNDQITRLAGKSSFGHVVMALDGDSADTDRGNVLLLPSGRPGEKLNPERVLYSFIEGLCNGDFPDILTKVMSSASSDQLRQDFLEHVGDLNDRSKAKNWWTQRKEQIQSHGLLTYWVEAHPEEVSVFGKELVRAVKATSQT